MEFLVFSGSHSPFANSALWDPFGIRVLFARVLFARLHSDRIPTDSSTCRSTLGPETQCEQEVVFAPSACSPHTEPEGGWLGSGAGSLTPALPCCPTLG